jgi:carboxylesterase
MSLVFSLDLNKSAEVTAVPNDEIVLSGTLDRTVILLHGLTGTPNEMRYLAFYLNKRGYNVACPRLTKHGQPLHVLKHLKWEEIYSDLRTVFLKALETGDKVYVAGLSMSALYVVLLAAEFGEKLAGGICLSPTLFFDGWNIPWYNWFLPLASYTPLKYNLYFKEGPPYGIKNERIRGMVDRYYSKAKLTDVDDISKFGYAFFPVSLFYQLHRLVKTVKPLLGKVKAPLLLIHPQEDDTASVKNSQFIFDRVASKTKKLVILNDSYHVITADQERETVAREMKDFLDTL